MINRNVFFRIVFGIFLILSFQLKAQTNFRPSDLPGLSLWLRADSGITFNGTNVTQWDDLSGNGNHASQGSLSKMPGYSASLSSINNKPSINFFNSDLTLVNNPVLNLPDYTIFMVGKINDFVNGGYVYDFSDGHYLATVVSGGTNFIYDANIAVPFDTSSFFLNNRIFDSNASPTTTFNINYSALPYTSNLGIPTNASFKHFGVSPAGNYSNASIAEFIVYDHKLSPAEFNDALNYLRSRYAPPVDLGIDRTSFCDTSLNAGSRFKSFLWSTGDTTQTIDLNNSGTYWVQAKDIFGYTSSDTVLVNYPQLNSISDTTICSGDSIEWNINLNKALYTFNWQDNSTDSIFNITQSGQYYVSVTNTLGCSKTSDTISVTIDNFPLIASLGNDTSLCSGNSIYLKNGAVQATNYLWSDTSTNDSLQINTSGQYWVTVSNINGCSKKDTINIGIAGNAPTALFSSNNTCLGNAIQFNDLSTPPSGDIISSWNWNFGDNTTSAFQNQSHMFADTGSYVVKLIVTTNAGCSAPYARIIHVYPNPVASFTSSNLCQNTNIQFTGNAITNGYPINQWNWNFSDPSSGTNDSSLVQNPRHIYLLNGAYPVRLIVSNINGCADTVVNNVIIKPSPVTNFSSSLSCKTDLTQFTDNTVLPSATSVQSSFWNFGDLVTSTLLKPKHSYSANVSYNVTHVITATNGCKDTSIKTVTVYPKPFAYFSYGNTCVGAPVDFNDLSVISGATITGWQWDFGLGTSTLQNPQHTFATSGNINTQLIVISDHGCKDTAVQSIIIHSNPVASFTFNPAYGTPPLTAFFNNTSTGATSYSWNFDDSSALSTSISPSHIFNDTGSFQISLAAINAFGCTDTIIHSINTTTRITDAAISGFTTTFQNDFLTITAQIDNHGTVDIHTMELYAKVNDGPFIKEEWGGSLLKDGTMFYTFNSDVFVTNEDHYICVSIQKPNGVNDDRPSDNEFCQTLSIAGFQMFSPYPNPTENMITLPVFMPVLNDLSIVVYNDQGKKVEDVYSGSLDGGFHAIQFNTEGLNVGLYVFKIKYKNETLIRKFIKK